MAFDVVTCGVNQNHILMKKMIFSLAMVLLAMSCFSQEGIKQVKLGLISSHYENFDYLNGKVKEIQYRTFHLTEENGKIIKGKPFTLEDAVSVVERQAWTYLFNEAGQLVQQMLEVDSAHTWTSAVHHENGRIGKLYWMMHDTLHSYLDVLYPDEGTIEILLHNIYDNTLYRKQVFELDKEGNLVGMVNSGSNGEVYFIMEFERNSEGKTTLRKGFNGDGTLNFHFTNFKYNDQGLIETIFINWLNGEEVNRQEGLRLYEFDSQGNWIKLQHEGWMIVERKIVYYD